ncbi:tautomerase family protein [Lactobacillus sp. S2-2]|uniref:tautomerase family protein n=1 Tax=Lactobacillus sp. S2-2 TaxID=2692917 RepID=UPI001F20CB2A|nr:tautomerase family protein [Lactobacillus sp. S2-2]MCF6514913.1 tautomerase family protein [Lactobacillus sp. S2-2]
MPLMRVDLIKGKDEAKLKQILDIAYEVQVETLKTPERDRYQVLTQHEPFEMQIQDTGLGIDRSEDVIVFNVTSRPRPAKLKQLFYQRLVERLEKEVGIKKEDVVFSMVSNNDDDWSFGKGETQFLNGEL